MAATEGGLTTTLSSSSAPGRTELVGPGATLADERLLPVLPALQPLLPHPGLRRGATVAVTRSAALALALVAGASAAGSWVAAVGLPDLGIVAAAETGIVLERLALVPAPGARVWPTVVAALLDAVDVVLVRSPPGLPDAQARRLIARARERGAVLVPLGPWPQPADLRLAVTASTWHGIGQGHGHLHSRLAEVVATGRGAATRERRTLLWLPSPDGTVTPAAGPGAAAPGVVDPGVMFPGAVDPGAVDPGAVDSAEPSTPRLATLPIRGPRDQGVGLPHAPAGTRDPRVGPGGPAGLALAGEGDAPAGEGRATDAPAGDAPAGEGRATGESGLPAPAQLPGRAPEAPLADAG
jgi:hypothetical protein